MTRRLEHAGFVRRSPSTEDKRAFLTEATPPVAACASRSGISGARSKKSVSAGWATKSGRPFFGSLRIWKSGCPERRLC